MQINSKISTQKDESTEWDRLEITLFNPNQDSYTITEVTVLNKIDQSQEVRIVIDADTREELLSIIEKIRARLSSTKQE
jgi:hypothetical protein